MPIWSLVRARSPGRKVQVTDIDGVARFHDLKVDAVDTYMIRFSLMGSGFTITATFDAAP